MNKEQLAALRKLAEEATPVAYQSTRNGFIAKENKNPEYNTPLYKFDPSTILQLLDYIETLEKDAARYRWLRERMIGVDFDWCESGNTVLAFEMPFGCSFGCCCDKNIDAAMQGETK